MIDNRVHQRAQADAEASIARNIKKLRGLKEATESLASKDLIQQQIESGAWKLRTREAYLSAAIEANEYRKEARRRRYFMLSMTIWLVLGVALIGAMAVGCERAAQVQRAEARV